MLIYTISGISVPSTLTFTVNESPFLTCNEVFSMTKLNGAGFKKVVLKCTNLFVDSKKTFLLATNIPIEINTLTIR